MYYYVYKITNIIENKGYIGSRGSKRTPMSDLGKFYFSSCKDKFFISDQKINPHNYKYEIIKEFKTRKEAYRREIELHEEFNIPSNPSFYNRSRQKVDSFSTEGVVFINGKKYSKEEYKKQNKVKHHCFKKVTVKDESGNTSQVDVTDERYIKGILVHNQKNMVNAIDKNGKKVLLSKEEYYKGKYTCNNTGKVPVKNKKGDCFLIEKNSPLLKNGEVCHVFNGLVSAYDNESKEYKAVSKKEFDDNKNLVGVNSGNISGFDNPNAKIIKIFNNNNELVVECKGNFKETCFKNKFPFAALRDSIYDRGKPIFMTKRHLSYATKNNLLHFIGWYALED